MEKKILEILKNGSIIAFPTDTVYGIGCDAFNTKAIERIYKLKKRPRNKPLVLFIRNRDQLENYIRKPPAFAERLMDKFWPGPLTLIFRAKKNAPLLGGHGGTISVRIPNNKEILKILDHIPLATTSCNYNGSPPAMQPDDINIEGISYIIKGKCNGIPSTVFSIPNKTILRKGMIGIYDIETSGDIEVKLGDGLKFCVLFVCIANLCRSPMAEGIFNKIKRNERIEVFSCGISPSIGSHPTKYAIEVMKEIGYDISSFKAKFLSKDLILRADIILTMEEKEKRSVLDIVKSAESKVRVLGVSDPIGGGKSLYRQTRDELLCKLKPIVKEIEKRL